MEYTVLMESYGGFTFISKAIKKLIENVNQYIQAGWMPLGGITFADDMVFQAMVKGQ